MTTKYSCADLIFYANFGKNNKTVNQSQDANPLKLARAKRLDGWSNSGSLLIPEA